MASGVYDFITVKCPHFGKIENRKIKNPRMRIGVADANIVTRSTSYD